MKKITHTVTCFLLALTAFFPVATAGTAVCGYEITLRSVPVFAIILAVVSGFTLTLHLVCKPKRKLALAAVIAVANIINTILLFFADNTPLVIVCGVLSAAFCCMLLVLNGKKLSARITTLVLSALLLIPVCYFGFIFLIFGSIGQNEVVQSAVSPDEKYIAEVINSDQGALGGDTLVKIRENGSFDAVIFEINKKPQRIFMGDRPAKDIILTWKNENCLLINGHEYTPR